MWAELYSFNHFHFQSVTCFFITSIRTLLVWFVCQCWRKNYRPDFPDFKCSYSQERAPVNFKTDPNLDQDTILFLISHKDFTALLK